MTNDQLPNLGQVSTEIIDGLRIRLLRNGGARGLPVLFTSPGPKVSTRFIAFCLGSLQLIPSSR
jgi:hypothetical protein